MHAEVAKRMLVRYFKESVGLEDTDFDKPLSPTIIINITKHVPELADKIEVVPYISYLDPMTGRSEIGWMLFVLGIHSMYLGKTKHDNLSQVSRLAQGQMEWSNTVETSTTPKAIIEYIRKKLANSENGRIDFGREEILPTWMRKPTITSPTASYYEKRRWG